MRATLLFKQRRIVLQQLISTRDHVAERAEVLVAQHLFHRGEDT